VELEKVVRGRDEPPFGADGRAASSSETVDAAVELRLTEHGLDHRLALAVKPAAALAGEDAAHEGVIAACPAAASALALAGVRRDQHLDATIDDVLHLLLMPVAGIRKQHLRPPGAAGDFKLALRGVEHRLQMPEVGRRRHHFGGDDDLALIGHRLGVVALNEAAQPLHDTRIGVTDIDSSFGRHGRRVGIRRPAEPAPVSHAPRPVALVGGVGADLGPELFFQAPLGFLEPLRAAARDRPRLLLALSLELTLGFAQPRAPSLAGAQLRGQLVAAGLAVKLILSGVDG
jgi:hypothetical protein